MGRRKNAPRRSEGDIWSAHNYIPIVKKHRTLRKHAPPHKLKVVGPTEECKHLLLGKVMVGTSNNTVPTTFQVCRILFKTRCEENEANDQDTIVLEYDENTLVVMKSLIEMEVLKDVVTSKVLSLSFCIEDDKAFAYVFLRKLPLASVHHKALKSLKTVFKWIFNIETDISKDIKGDLHGSSEISTLYNKLVQLRSEKYEFWQQTKSDSEIHPFLKVSLRPYQVEAVRWMLHRENIDFSKLHSGKIHPLYTAVTLPSGLQVYFVPFSGYVSNTYPQIEPCIRGGILADEMGLGKTVEVLACILLHPKDEHVFLQDNGEMKPIIISAKRKKMNSDREEETYTQAEGPQTTKKIKEIQRNIMKVNPKKTATKIALETWYNKKLGEYFCSQCWMSQPLIEIGATLIVTPLSLRKQWISEIRRHIGGGIKVLRYDGCNSMVIYPTDLKNYDIVVTTYNVLQSELRLTEQSNIVNLRRERKYSPLGCPLTRVKWWRICLDEAQTVDAPKKMVSEMARKICAEYRWAVTGTPINKNISDLHGLVDYLQITPYDDLETWKNILYVPYMSGDEKPMLDFLSDVLWRSSKADVYDQINIPKQTFKQHFLEFSAVEKFFYKREHELSCNDFLRKVRNRDPSLLLERIEKTTLNSILAPLLSLRHACTHPNTSRGRYLATKKQLTSMQDLLEALIQKNISDSEECLRLIISSLNGLAGIHLLQGKHREAIGYYRDVLQLRATFSDGRAGTKLPVDKLQLVHTMHNLAEVLEQHPPKQPTLRDELLRKDCIEVEHKYMEKFINEASEAYRTCKDYVSKIEDLENKLILKYGQWYSDGLDWILINDHFNEFLTKIQVACNNANIKLNLTSTSERNIMRTIYEWNEGIVSCRNKLLESLNRLYDVSEEDRIRVLAKGSLVNSAMNCHLRPQNKQQKVKKCPVCLANIRLKQYEGKLFNMEKRKKNFEDMSLMGSWKPSMEELICKTLCSILKIKHSSPELYKDGETHMNVLETMKKEFKEVRHFWTLLDQQICAEDELDICKLRLQLKEVEDSDEGIHSKNETHARILKSLTYTMENKNENMHLLTVHETQKDHIQCSICRNKQKYQDISYIKAGHTVMDGDCLNIKGNYSTKIEAVIKLLMELKEENPVPKVLLFSSWHSVLKNIKEALDKNEITSELISASSHFEMKIENFKVQLIQTDFTRSWFLSKMLCLLWKDKVVNDLSKKEFMHPRIIEGILQKQNVNLIYVTDMCYTAIC
ncbi:unnamed protein product [Acanthoscelides obtectus]|uniref:Helicase ATP-binding domain-containing protein n=1 Tax=Acanthoscelides obtectus TaxID=200917 RepID=A0A9P0PJ30_ACAOB|nr:unnamed protein product [Acanthoscelides obtectus]CAK1624098.1 E3 ubiquitin-protein ligase SHPRH [Acanthoscelides obtectus]